ncbi:MAG TPA: helix-turn-helix transcriptional regulator [Solirubrobacteraceae bacterium]
MLTSRTILSRDGITISDVQCRHRRGRGEVEHYTGQDTLVFVRRGCFTRTVAGEHAVLEPSVLYTMSAGDEQRCDHPHEGGDDCTTIGVDDSALGALEVADTGLPSGVIASSPAIDLEHRLLLAAARRGEDRHEVFERATRLLADALAAPGRTGPPAQRSRLAARHRLLADQARESLACDPHRSLPELAAELAVSPFHLSRTFRSVTGHTLARHRIRVRVRAALERLADGERDLARLSADCGFADQSHLCRAVRSESGGLTPSELRGALLLR